MDLHLLNHDGNIIDAASIAAIVALCHFRRPDVSVQGDEVTLVSSHDSNQASPYEWMNILDVQATFISEFFL